MATFVIKHKSGGKFIHPDGGSANPSNDTDLILHEDVHDRMYFQFDIVEDSWGYIRHKASGKFVHPFRGSLSPGNNTKLVLHSDRHSAALFALDDGRDYIIHKGGKLVHPKDGSPNPGNGNSIVLHESEHDAMQWLFVSPEDTSKEVLVYGKPNLVGEWKVANAVLNPRAEHNYSMEIKVGKSKSESKKSGFEFKWETGVQVKCFSCSTSVSTYLEKASSSTWTEEKTVRREIKVVPGKSVVTWQYVFTGSQCDHQALFRANILADTESTDVKPDELAGESI